MKYAVKFTSKFKRDYKLAIKRGYPIKLLEETVSLIANGKTLPEKYMDHALSGNWTAYRDCHIKGDWLLVYRIANDVLVLTLTRTGTHADLFGK
ncbi:MAG: type II toxin-antitoxin system YafQ family toxin [Sporolactobacillus sp.]